MASPTFDPDESPEPTVEGPLADDLLAIRERLKRARAERGACPPWDELRADLLPGGSSRPGRAERLAHHAVCPYCDVHVSEWRKSFDHASDTLGAIERGVARGLVEGAKGLAGRIVTSARRLPQAPPEAPFEPAAPVPAAEATPEPPRAVPTYTPPPPPRHAPERTAPRAVPVPTGGLLVVECVAGRVPPDAIFLCAGALGLEVACVDRVEELEDDPDLALVQAVIIASDRTPEEWPQVVRRAKKLVSGRPVLVLAMFGQDPSKGARRALGEALLPMSASPEALLIALDPRLR